VAFHATEASIWRCRFMDMLSISAIVVPEQQARARLRAHPGDGLETWLADQPWRATQDGSWLVEADRGGRTYRIEGILGGSLRIVEHAPDGAITPWLIAG
jgi:hypothetical protein